MKKSMTLGSRSGGILFFVRLCVLHSGSRAIDAFEDFFWTH